MFTDIPWGNDGNYHKLNFNSFIFSLDKDSLTKYEHDGKDNEVFHEDDRVFNMGCPMAIMNENGRTASSYLG